MPSVDTIRENLIPVFGRYGVRKAILFGSYAKGMANERSDVDIYVEDRVNGKESLGDGDPLVRAVVKRALKPLSSGGNCRVKRIIDNKTRQRTYTLTPHRIAFIRHS